MTLSRLLANLFVLFAFATGSGFAQEVMISEFMAHNETVHMSSKYKKVLSELGDE